MLKLIKALSPLFVFYKYYICVTTFILIVAIHILLKIKFIISYFLGGDGDKDIITSLYCTEIASLFEKLSIL